MKKMRWRVMAAVALVVLSSSGCTGESQPTPIVSTDVSPPTVAEIQALEATLPDDQILAAMALVDSLFGADRRVSIAATAELFVHSGLALTDDKPAVILAPQGMMASDEFVPITAVPTVTDSVRSGSFVDPDSFASFLTALGVTESPLSTTGVSALMHGWGKTPSATEQDVFVGAAIRALAAQRGALAIGDGPNGLDSLQQVLLFSRITASFIDVPDGAAGGLPSASPAAGAGNRIASERTDGGTTSTAVLRSSLTSDCEEELNEAESLVKKYAQNAATKFIEAAPEILELTQTGSEVVVDDVAKFTAKSSRTGLMIEKFGGVVGHLDTITTVWQTALQTLLLIAGIRLKLEDNASGHETHFRHRGDGADGTKTNVTFTATVGFDHGNISKDKLACYRALGIDVPDGTTMSGQDKNGKSNGWFVVWGIGENLAPNNWFGAVPHGDVLRPAAPDWGNGRQELGADGTAKMVTRTRTERDPPQNKGSVHKVSVDVSAHVDYSKPMDLTQFTDVTDIMVWLAGDIARSINFPTVTDRVTVGYHGPDVYVARGHAVIGSPFSFASMTLDADTYSCDGLAGPWGGKVTLGGQTTEVGKILGEMLGAPSGPDKGETGGPISFRLDPASNDPQRVPGPSGIDLRYELPNLPQRGEHIDGFIGEATWILPNSDVGINELIRGAGMYPFASGLTMDVRGVPHDDRCPGPAFAENGWD